MGVAVSHQLTYKGSLFINEDLEECCPVFASSSNAMGEFVRYIKDGGWIELLSNSELFLFKNRVLKEKSIPVTFYSTSVLSFFKNDPLFSQQGSVRTSSSSTRDSRQGSVENFTDFYANIEDRSPFSPDEMIAFVASIVYPIYLNSGKRPRVTKDDLLGLQIQLTPPEYEYDKKEDKDIGQLQELLLSAAAFFDESELRKTLSGKDWLRTLNSAVNDCPLNVCICEVDEEKTRFPPVLINNVARKRVSTLNRSHKSQKYSEMDFLQLWSIEHEEEIQAEIAHNLSTAQPMRLYSCQSTGSKNVRSVLDVVHIHDADGAHRFVLGVQMDIPEHGESATHLQYLRDTSLLIAHLIKCPAARTPQTSPQPSPNSR